MADQHYKSSTATLGTSASPGGAAWIWQGIGALDGPNAPWYHSPIDVDVDEDQQHPAGTRCLKGFPTPVEPGAWILDSTNQHGNTNTFVQESNSLPTSATSPADRAQQSPKLSVG